MCVSKRIYREAARIIRTAIVNTGDLKEIAKKAMKAARPSGLRRSFKFVAKTGKLAGLATPGATKPQGSDQWVRRAQLVPANRWKKAFQVLGLVQPGAKAALVKIRLTKAIREAAVLKAPAGFEPKSAAVLFAVSEEDDVFIVPKILIKGELEGSEGEWLLIHGMTVDRDKFLQGLVPNADEAEDEPVARKAARGIEVLRF